VLIAGPKALDEEDVDFLDDLEKTRSRAMQIREQQEQMAMESFRAARSHLTAVATMEGQGLSGATNSNNNSHSSGVGFVIPQKREDSQGTFSAKPVIIGE
jgi:FAM192A/Fyv6, N-terminal domain